MCKQIEKKREGIGVETSLLAVPTPHEKSGCRIILCNSKHQLIYVDYHAAKVGNGSSRFSETISYLIDRITLLIA